METEVLSFGSCQKGHPTSLLPQSTCQSAEASTWLQCPRAVGSSARPWASCTQGPLSAVQGQLGGAQAGMERVCLCQLLGLAHREALWGGRAALPGERQPRSRIQVLSVGRDEPGISEVGGATAHHHLQLTSKEGAPRRESKEEFQVVTYLEGQVKVKVSREARRLHLAAEPDQGPHL